LLEFDKAFVDVYCVLTVLLLIWKASVFSYDGLPWWTPVCEVGMVFFLYFLNFFRRFFALGGTALRKDRNVLETITGPSSKSVLLLSPVLVCYSFFLQRQLYVLSIDRILATTGVIFAMIHAATFFFRRPLTPSNVLTCFPIFVLTVLYATAPTLSSTVNL